MHSLEKRVLLPANLQPIKDLKEYKDQGGLKALKTARSMSREELIELVKASGLRGRGGAGFPAAIKWDTVYHDECATKYLVCNGAEGEPGTFKDRYLISKNPYSLLEGMLIAAYAIDAKQAILGTKLKFKPTVARLETAIKELEADGVLEPGYLRLVLGPDEYLLGEEKGLLEVIDGRPAMPRNFPPFMVGVAYTPTDCNPTVVNNAETMAHLPNIVNQGAEWFRALGTDDTPGTVIITLTGDVKNQGMFEIEAGITLEQLLNDIGGGPARGKPFKAVFSGMSNRVATPDLFKTVMDFGSMRQAGIGLGSGGFIVYDEGRDMVEVALMYSRFLAASSCGQCVPCNMGTRVITEHIENIALGKGNDKDLQAIKDELTRCTNQTRCFLPQQEQIVMNSLLDKFYPDFEAYVAQSKVCEFELTLPKIEQFDEEQSAFIYQDNAMEATFRPWAN